jgi:GTP pyrophosphokinase
MHNESEYGIASHISYKQGLKKNVTNPNLLWIKKILPSRAGTSPHTQDTKSTNTLSKEIHVDDVPKWVKELVDYQKANDTDGFLDDIKTDFLEERIFVFTPKGDVVDLPTGSTVIDFAYAIHSDIGDHMSGAKVNGKLVALDTELINGDRVEIQTKPSAKPNRKWVGMCRTSIAKRHIRSALEK